MIKLISAISIGITISEMMMPPVCRTFNSCWCCFLVSRLCYRASYLDIFLIIISYVAVTWQALLCVLVWASGSQLGSAVS